MTYKTLDWKRIAAYLGKPVLTRQQRTKLKAQLRRAFKADRIVAGTTHLTRTSTGKLIGCALGQANEAGIDLHRDYRRPGVVATINNYACTGDGEIPQTVLNEDGIPRNGGGAKWGKKLTRLAPLLKLVDLL